MLLTVLGGTVALCASMSAHHSFALQYLEDQMVSVEGEIMRLEYRSPHSWVYVNARDDAGVMRQVGAEWASAPRLKQSGVGEDTLTPGDRVVISGSPSRDPAEYRMHLKSIQRRADGWQWSGPSARR
jgi:hypothetical protein